MGDAVALTNGSTMAMALQPFAAAAARPKPAIVGLQANCQLNAVGPGCLFELLKITPCEVLACSSLCSPSSLPPPSLP